MVVALDEPLVRGESERLLSALGERGLQVNGIVWNRASTGVPPLPTDAIPRLIDGIAPTAGEPGALLKPVRERGGLHDRDAELVNVEVTAPVLPDDVIVVATAQRFYVNGEVKKPGDYGYERGLTLHMAITMAGGFTEKASKKPTVLRIVNGKEQSLELSLDAPVLPDDIIVVTQRFF